MMTLISILACVLEAQAAETTEETTMLRAGFATTNITPPLGQEIPGLFERRFAEGVHDDLFARAAVVDDGKMCVALVQVDSIFVNDDVVAAARAEAERLCGIPGANCLIGATHTHSGGPVFRGFLSEINEDYQKLLIAQIASAIAEAHRLMRPAVAGSGAGQAPGVAFNRRFIMKDGTQKTHPGKMNPDIVEPAGPEDPTVTVVAFRAPDGEEPFGCIVNFACHGTHMNGLLFSADYPKWIVDTLRGVYGPEFGVVFLNGACGDVTQVNNRSAKPREFGLPAAKNTGRVVGGEALKVLSLMDYAEKTTLDVAAEIVHPSIRVSSPEAIQKAQEYLDGKRKAEEAAVFSQDVLDQEAGAKQQKKEGPVDVEAIFAQGVLDVEAMRKETPTLPLEIQGVRIGDTLFWSAPGELFQTYALEVRAQSPFAHTCCVELANGYAGYICTPAAFAGGGYEVRTVRSSLLDENAGAELVRAAVTVAKTLFDRR